MSCACVVCTSRLTTESRQAADTFLVRVEDIVAKVHYRPNSYQFEIAVDRAQPDNGRVFVQLLHWRPDADTGAWGWGKGGKRYLSPHMTDSEIVRVLLSAALAYEEHEVREFFTYRGKRIFGPHVSIEALAEVADRLDIRP